MQFLVGDWMSSKPSLSIDLAQAPPMPESAPPVSKEPSRSYPRAGNTAASEASSQGSSPPTAPASTSTTVSDGVGMNVHHGGPVSPSGASESQPQVPTAGSTSSTSNAPGGVSSSSVPPAVASPPKDADGFITHVTRPLARWEAWPGMSLILVVCLFFF